MKRLSRWILGLFGWRITQGVPPEIKKCVIVVAPHTSNWDFVIGRLAFFALGLPVRFLIKKEIFVFPLGPLLKWLGGIPVDRRKSGGMVAQVARMFDRYEQLYIIITPEGTRSLNPNWKKGFYYIALKANVPLALGVLDYREKWGGIEKILYPSGDFEKDFKEVEEVYRGRGARHPEKFNLS
ncbi:MAG: lysophospholipid acyltransferase family protein [Bacteroidales bacterium]